jgi:carbonic anhydrase/acetyltransferase-like protein (isoleucine patch superfamily)
MNAVIMDRVVVEDECIIGALSFVNADTHIPKRSVVVGNPAKIVKQVSDEMLAWKTEGTAVYQRLPEQCRASLKPCEPLRSIPADRQVQQGVYKTWNEAKPNQ